MSTGIMAFAWADHRGSSPHIEPMVWGGGPFVTSPYTQRWLRIGTAAENGIAAQAAIAAKPRGRRCLLLAGFGVQRTDIPDLGSRHLRSYLRYGPAIEGWMTYMDEYFAAYKAAGGATIDCIALDFEAFTKNRWAFSTAEEWADAVMDVYADPSLRLILPPSLRTVTRDQLLQAGFATAPYAQLVIDWNVLTNGIMINAISRGLTSIITAHLGSMPAMMNDGDLHSNKVTKDYNGWNVPIGNLALTRYSNPELYIFNAREGQRYSGRSGQWPSFVDQVNRFKSSVGPIRPWITPPGYQGDNSGPSLLTAPTSELIRHIATIGGTEPSLVDGKRQCVFYFNPTESSTERTFMEALFAGAPAPVTGISRDLTPDGSSTVTTGPVLTSYDPDTFGAGGVVRNPAALDQMTPIYMISFIGNTVADPIHSLDNLVVNPATMSDYLTTRIKNAVAAGERHLAINLPQGYTPEQDFPANCFSALLPHVRDYFLAKLHLAAVEQARAEGLIPADAVIRWSIYLGIMIDANSYANPTSVVVDRPSEQNIFDSTYVTDAQRQELVTREWMPWTQLGFEDFIFDALTPDHLAKFRALTAAHPTIKVAFEAHPLTEVGSDPDGPGGGLFDLDLTSANVTYGISDFHALFDRNGRWVIPGVPGEPAYRKHCILYRAFTEAQITSLHNRGFVVGILQRLDGNGPDEALVRKVRNSPRDGRYMTGVSYPRPPGV